MSNWAQIRGINVKTKKKSSNKQERELLPCPFCGSKKLVASGDGDSDYVECRNCGVFMSDFFGIDAFSLWNTRT